MRPRSIIAAIICSMVTAAVVHILDRKAQAVGPIWGDANGDWKIDIGDPIYLLQYIFADGPAPVPACARPEVAPRFIEDRETVLDRETGLMWIRDPLHGVSHEPLMSLDDAHIYCSALRVGGYEDWTVPTIEQLLTIVRYNTRNPALPPEFPRMAIGVTWSATHMYGGPDGMYWVIDLTIGHIRGVAHDSTAVVRAVRRTETCY